MNSLTMGVRGGMNLVRIVHRRRDPRRALMVALLVCALVSCSGGSDGIDSTRTPLAGDVDVCQLIRASRMEQIFGEPVVRYYRSHHPAKSTGSWPEGMCNIYFTTRILDSISIEYTGLDYFPQLNNYGGTTFEEAYNGPDTMPFTPASGVEGRGATWGGSVLMWRYPDGTFLKIYMFEHGPSSDGPTDWTDRMIELFEVIGGPLQEQLSSTRGYSTADPRYPPS